MVDIAMEDHDIPLHEVANKFGEVPLDLRASVYLEFVSQIRDRGIVFDNVLANLEVQ